MISHSKKVESPGGWDRYYTTYYYKRKVREEEKDIFDQEDLPWREEHPIEDLNQQRFPNDNLHLPPDLNM